MAYADPADLATLLGQTLTAGETEQAQLLLDLVSAEVDEAAGRATLGLVTGDEVTLDGPGTQTLLLPSWPVEALAAVTENDVTLDAGGDYEWSADGWVRRTGRVWTATPRGVTVVYTHGFTAVPEAVRALVLRVAQRGWNTAPGLSGETVGDYSYQIASDGAGARHLTRVDRRWVWSRFGAEAKAR